MKTQLDNSKNPTHYVRAIEDMLLLVKEHGLTEEQEIFIETIKGSLASLREMLKTQANSGDTPEASAPGRILVVDDDALQRVWATRVLEKAGYSTICAETGPMALALLGSNSVDAILMDCEIPQLDGFEVTEEIRKSETLANVQIVAYSSYKIPGYKERCLNIGMNYFLPKPASAEDLLKAIQTAVSN